MSGKKNKVVKALASLQLAVIIILLLAGITAWGTFVEAKYGDATAAQKIVYHSPWMYTVLILLAVNLIFVMVDRWPWQKKHTGFVLAHIGILILMMGSVLTRYFGVDGSMSMGIGEEANSVSSVETGLAVYASLDGSSYRKLFDREVDFFRNPPSTKEAIEVALPSGSVRVVEYLPYASRDEKVIEVTDAKEKDKFGAAIRFQLQNENVSVSEWLLQNGPGKEAIKDLGPAQLVLTSGAYQVPSNRNAIVLRPGENEEIRYEIHSARDPGKPKTGVARAGDTIETGWMGMVLRLLKHLPSAKQEVTFKATKQMTPLTTAAIRVEYNGAQHWVSANSMLKLFSDDAVYILAYANRRIDIGFKMKLKEFRIGRYQGTMRAASYESLVDVPGLGERLISMNEPLKHAGYTFYQSSFQEDEKGQPIASVLSVNWDPGRWIKYLGSLLIVLGTIHLFYFKSRSVRKQAAKAPAREVA